LNIWRWLYDYPAATAADLKKATIETAKDIWNRLYARIFGCEDEIILAIYSHMINHPLYLAEYPLGHLIHFQIEEYIKGKNIGEEMERMCSAGNILPQLWMKNAVGAEFSAEPFLDAAAEAIGKMS
jgi:oligoendopeptidase F